MKIVIIRKWFTAQSTIGLLLIDDDFECYSLEDRVHDGPKVPGQTAIPEGTYEIVIDFSNRFNKMTPHILHVPDFEGIRIHKGNRAEDSEGCILVGTTRQPNFIGFSKQAYDHLFDRLEEGLQYGPVYITITHERKENET